MKKADDISSISIYKENKPTLIKLVQRICSNHKCTTEDALKALVILFKNGVASDFESVNESLESIQNKNIQMKLLDYSEFKKDFILNEGRMPSGTSILPVGSLNLITGKDSKGIFDFSDKKELEDSTFVLCNDPDFDGKPKYIVVMGAKGDYSDIFGSSMKRAKFYHDQNFRDIGSFDLEGQFTGENALEDIKKIVNSKTVKFYVFK